MFPAAEQIRADLRGVFRGSLAFDNPTRALYSTDGSPFQIVPHGVAVPLDADDLSELIKYAHSVNLPVIARGAGTGLAGESLGAGLIVDLSQNFHEMAEPIEGRVRVGAGVALDRLNAFLFPFGQRIGPDPANGATATIGGLIAGNASGANVAARGYFRDAVHSLEVCWDDGTRANLGPGRNVSGELRTTEIRSRTSALLSEYHPIIQSTRGRTPFDRAGYILHDANTASGLHLKRLLIGTEGTLAITTHAELKTIPLAGGAASAILAFGTLNEAVRAGLLLRTHPSIVSCEIFDQRWFSLGRSAVAALPLPVPPNTAGVMIASVEACTPAAARAELAAAIRHVNEGFPLQSWSEPTDAIRAFHRALHAGLHSPGSRLRPLAFVEDTAVPPESVMRYISGVADLLRRRDLTGAALVNPLAGQLQVRPLVDPDSPADREMMWALADDIFKLAISLGGTISTRNGTGIARTPWLANQVGPLIPVFAELKRIFDPLHLLNPGKIVGPDPSRAAWPLRETIPARQALLLWGTTTAEAEAGRCHGCGDCRVTTETGMRMCPSFHALGTEASSPRAQANLFRALGYADEPDARATVEARAIAENCINCKMCRTECPSQVNIPKLAIEAKAAHYAEHGLDRAGWLLARIEAAMTLGGNFAFSTNRILSNSAARWLLEKAFGIGRKRTLPKFTHRTFLRRAKTAGWTRRSNPDSDRPKIAYFVDTFANHHDPHVGEATVAVLRHHGFDVTVPPRQSGSGVAALVQGDIDTAREIAAANVRLLVDLVRSGYTIVCSEPTAALMLTQDYSDLFDDVDTELIAANTRELTEFLWGLHRARSLRTDFAHSLDVQLGHHVPCHIKALGGEPAGPKLLGLIPGVRVFAIDKSCSGMAGTHGLRANAYAASLKAGQPMLEEMKRPRVLFGSTECGACRMQIQEGSRKRALHPVQYLALAYGLMPEIWEKLRRPLTRLATE